MKIWTNLDYIFPSITCNRGTCNRGRVIGITRNGLIAGAAGKNRVLTRKYREKSRFFHCQNETFQDISSKNEIFTRQRGNNNVIISWSGISPMEVLGVYWYWLTSSLFLSKHQIAGLLFLLSMSGRS